MSRLPLKKMLDMAAAKNPPKALFMCANTRGLHKYNNSRLSLYWLLWRVVREYSVLRNYCSDGPSVRFPSVLLQVAQPRNGGGERPHESYRLLMVGMIQDQMRVEEVEVQTRDDSCRRTTSSADDMISRTINE